MKSMGPDAKALWKRYVQRRDPHDFEAIVSRFAGMVIGVAQRRTGDQGTAEEVAQNVFTLLARKAAEVEPDQLAGWLHRTALLNASNALRKESRRRRKLEDYSNEMKSAMTTPEDAEAIWEEAVPMLDKAIDELPDGQRKVVLMRFFEERSFKDIGMAIGKGEDAGRKRLTKALEKLSKLLKGRGVVLPATAIAAFLTKQAHSSVSSTTVHSISQSAIAAVASSSTLTSTLAGIMATTKLTIPALIAVGIAIPFTVQHAAHRYGESAIHSNEGIDRPSLLSLPHTTSEAAVGSNTNESKIDLAALAREINRIGMAQSTLEKEIDLQLLMFELSKEQLPPVLEMITSTKDPSSLHRIGEALFTRWAEFDPRQSLEVALQLKDRNLHYAAKSGAMRAWAAADPDAAINYVVEENADLAYLAISAIGERAPKEALDRSLAMEEGPLRDQLLEHSINFWAVEDPMQAFEWATTFEDDAKRTTYTRNVLEGLSSTHPELSTELALTIERPTLRETTLKWSLLQWSGKDPDAATEAYLNLPAEVRTDSITANLAGHLTAADPDRALKIASQLPDGSFHQVEFTHQAIKQLVDRPAEAAPLIETLPESRRRDLALKHVVGKWIELDRETAMKWIEQTGLDPNIAPTAQ